MLVDTRQKNIAQAFILERYFFDVYLLASRIRLQGKKDGFGGFEPTMWEKEARHIGGQEIKTATLFNA